MAGTASRLKKVPYCLRVLLYYVLVFFIFRYPVYGYLDRNLSRQILGVRDTFLTTLVILAHLLLCSIPPWLWSRHSLGRRLSRGLESFACYATVFMSLGFIYSLAEEGSWKAWHGLTAGGSVWERLLTTGALFSAFLISAWWGGRRVGHRRRASRARRR